VSPRFRPTWVRIDLAAIRHNAAVLRPEGVELMAVVKANAYGHGDVQVARAALEGGATWLGVALVEEGLALREAGIDQRILLLSEPPSGSEGTALAHGLTPTVYSVDAVRRIIASPQASPPVVHVKVDTGMHRVGVWPPEKTVPFLRHASDLGAEVEGLWTHLASSEEDPVLTKRQLERFAQVVAEARASGSSFRYVHAANSGGVLRHPEAAFDLVRPGIALYGVSPARGLGEGTDLRPALSWCSSVTFVKRLPSGERLSYGQRYELSRDAWVATVPVGYADGYPRALSSNAEVLIRGHRCRVAGNVTMDQLLVDCGDLEPSTGDEVVLIGGQDGERIDAWELAERAGTIAYEIVTRIGERVPREYVG
jgi:alanine racemase